MTAPVRIVVASGNPVKVEATRSGFASAFPGQPLEVEAVDVPSGVSNQPMSDDETLRGAVQRAREAARARPDADFWIGLEGGLHRRRVPADGPAESLEAFGWIVVRDAAGRTGRSRTASFDLPPAVATCIVGPEGLELGDAVDRIAGTDGLKRRGGAVGLLSAGALRRAELYAPSVLLALLPLLRGDLYLGPPGT